MLTTINKEKCWRNLFFGAVPVVLMVFFMILAPQLNTGASAATNRRTFDSADSCKERAAVVMSSFATETACENCMDNDSGRWGTVWVNMDASSNYSEGTNQMDKQLDEIKLIGYLNDGDDDYETEDGGNVDVSSKGRFTAYLHGQAASCGGTDSDPSTMNAKHVYFVDPTGSVDGITNRNDKKNFYHGNAVSEQILKNQKVSFILTQDTTLERIKPDGYNNGQPTYNNLPEDTWSKTGTPTPITVDLYKFSKYIDTRVKKYDQAGYSESSKKRFCIKAEDDDSTKSSCFIGVFRCPNSASSIGSSTCWANSTKITIDLLDGLDEFHGQIKMLDQDNMDTVYAKNNYDNNATYGSATTNNSLGIVPQNKDYILKSAAGTSYVTLDMKLEDNKWHKIRINNFLKVDGSGSSNWEVYNGNTKKSSGTDTPENAGGHKISQWDLCVKATGENKFDFYLAPFVKGQSCKDTITQDANNKVAASNIKDNNTTCFTLKYQKHSESNPNEYDYRSACLKLSSNVVTPPVVEGRISMNAAAAPTSNGSSNSSTAAANALLTASGKKTTAWDDGSSTSKTVTVNNIESDYIDTYAQWQFDAKFSKKGKFQYKLIECRATNDNCENWIKTAKVAEYGNQTDGETITNSSGQSLEGTVVHKKMNTSQNEYENTYTFKVTNETAAKRYEDSLAKNGKFTVCYKLFIGNINAADNKDEDWNTSVACAKFSGNGPSPEGDINGKTKVVIKTLTNGCTINVNDGSTNASVSDHSGKTWIERDIDNNSLQTIYNVMCDEHHPISSLDVVFSHIISSDDAVDPTMVDAYHRQGQGSQYDAAASRFHHKKIPSSRGKIDSVTLKSKKSGSDYVSGGNGEYTIDDGHYICEKLAIEQNDAEICVSLSNNIPNPEVSGRSVVEIVNMPAGCRASSNSIYQMLNKGNATRSYPIIGIECEGASNPTATVKFSHYASRTIGESPELLHRIYHNDNPSGGSVSPSVRHTHDANTPFNEQPIYTNGNGQYTLHKDETICESQWLGLGRENAIASGACIKLTNTITTCPASPEVSYDKTAGTSYLAISIKNVRTGASAAIDTITMPNLTSTTTILAKPTDEIAFNHCYFTGAQSVRTTEFWDKIKQETPTKPSTKSACKEEYKQGETAPTECSSGSRPTYTLSPKSTTCSNGDWINCDGNSGSSYNDYTVNTSKRETLHEANYDKISVDNDKYNSYGVGTTYPNTHTELGNGVYDGGVPAIDDTYTSSGYVAMKYEGEGFNGTTGTSGEVHTGVSQNANHTFVTVGAPGGYLRQSVSANVGLVKRKQHNQDWSWSIGYNFTPCMFKKKKGDDGKYLDPAEYESTCTEQSLKSVSSSSTGAGTGSGSHGSTYYERDTSATTYASKTLSTAVYVPYNYTSSALVTLGEDKIYAGEQFTLKDAFVYIEPTNHRYLGSSYATIAPDISVELYAYISDNDQASVSDGHTSGTLNGCAHYQTQGLECAKIDSTTKTFNHEGKLNGTKNENREYAFQNRKYNAFDYVAGRYLCVGIGFNKSTTSAYSYATDGNEVNTNSIYYSAPSCKQIYKKPTFAVWGGSVFSNGSVDVNKMEKRNVANYNSYQSQGTLYRVTFSPWVEGIVVANNDVKALASGASTAYTFAGDASTNYAPTAAPGGFGGNDYCNMSPLTIANENCSGGTAGNANLSNRTGVKEEILRRYVTPYFDFDANTQVSNSSCADNGRNKCLSPSDGVFSGSQIGATNVEYGKTYIYASKNDITINGDIVYKESYVSSNQVSQVIIYSKGDINITGDVNRIDAVLIAEGKVNTCSTSSDTCHNQLRINGSIIADKVELNRLYGASVGSYSVEPAEIVNFSPTIFLWSSVEGSNKLNEDLTETYTRELAPRQ